VSSFVRGARAFSCKKTHKQHQKYSYCQQSDYKKSLGRIFGAPRPPGVVLRNQVLAEPELQNFDGEWKYDRYIQDIEF
jgi:hypothetical protein